MPEILPALFGSVIGILLLTPTIIPMGEISVSTES